MGRLMSATTPRASRGPVHREVESSLASWEVLPVTISSGNSEARAGAIELKQHVVESFQNEKVIAEGEEGDDAATMVGTLSGSETSKSVGEHMDFVLAKDAEVADQLQSLQIASPQPLIAQFSTNVQLLRNPLLNSIVRLNTGSPDNLVGSNSAAQSVLAHNTPELADNLVQSVFDELVRVSAPTRGPRFDPLLSSSEPWTLQPWSSPEDRLEPQHADQDPASFLLSYDQMNSDPSNDLIDNGGIAAQSSVPAMWPGTQDGVCAGGLEHIQSDSYNIEDNTDIESSLLLGYNVIGPGSADFLKWEGNEDFQLWN
ncbi:hypothetical protein CGMCC3_g8319 [Colletotrichum fructicola]|nr:uncharacterized protein CGMCC3_g8319 [Colletotrichum fructicola]KAE9575687.1 hypothetical protein CGMCC3_g8319 [Colletotrichum fructicola]